MACSNARDTITQSAGLPLTNHYDYPDDEHVVTSYCRTTDGTWIAWKNIFFGDSIDPDSGLPDNDTNKADWPARIASTNAVAVGFFPDDGSAPIVYELGIDPLYDWLTGVLAARDPCSLFPFVGDSYANNPESRLISWGMGLIDVQVRTDGSNVWVITLAHEAVKYPFLYNSPLEIDNCGNTHPTFEDYWAAGHDDAFFHDTDSGNTWWLYGPGQVGGNMPFGAYDDPGQEKSFRWQPARVTVWGGDIGGFTRLDTIEAKFDNASEPSGLCSGIEAAASPAEPGVLHVLWSEGGNFGSTAAPMRGQRINYSRWSPDSKTLDTDLLYEQAVGYGDASDPALTYVPDDQFVWTAEMILRNDHGSPIAIVWPWLTDNGPQSPSSIAQFWDLSDGSATVLQTLDPSLVPTAGEGLTGTLGGTLFNHDELAAGATPQRSQFASSLYTDPTLADRDVYLICARYESVDAIYRVPCDGSSPFDFMDGIRLANYSLVPTGFVFVSDFVCDPDNVWVPAGSDVLHFTRRCIPTWEQVPAFPIDETTGEPIGEFVSGVSPPSIVTDDEGDWLAGGGNGPRLAISSTDPTNIAALRAKICRCCVPCEALGVRLWKRV